MRNSRIRNSCCGTCSQNALPDPTQTITAPDTIPYTTQVSNIALGSQLYGIEVNSNTNQIYACLFNGTIPSTISIINGISDTVSSNILLNIAGYPYGVSVNTTTNKIYISYPGSKSVVLINGNTNAFIRHIGLGDFSTSPTVRYDPYSIKVNSVTNKFY